MKKKHKYVYTNISILVFFFLVYIIGFYFGFFSEYNGLSTSYLENKKIQEIEFLYGSNNFDKTIYILKNNLTVCIKLFLLGVFSIGILSVLYIFQNAYVLGLVFGYYSRIFPTYDLIQVVLPHSIEIVGIVLSGYIGFNTSIFLILKKKLLETKSIAYLIAIMFFLIIISAFLESYVSMQ